MIKKVLALSVLTMMVFILATAGQAQDAGKIKAYLNGLENKMAVAKKAKNAARIKTLQSLIDEARTALKKAEKEEVRGAKPAPEPEEDKFAEYMEGNNKAIAELKGQIDKVKGDNSDAKIGALIFFRWQKYTQNGGSHPNNFDVDRAYIDIKKKLDRGASARMTLDVARITGSARQNLFDYLKYAYVELPVSVPAFLQPVPYSLTGKVGLQHTVWIDWADKMLGLRYIAKSLMDNEGVMSSSDFGLGALGKVSIPGVPEVEYHATLLNGTGYATSESDSKKAVAARFNAIVYESESAGKVTLGVFGNVESLNSSINLSGSNKQAGLGIGYQHELGRAYLEYVTGSKSNKKVSGYSLGGVFDLGGVFEAMRGYNLFARIDNYDPDTNASNNEKNKSFYGITYDWGKDVKMALDLQNSQTGNGSTTSIMYLHSMIQL